jgi:tetratricopeptide (TPR) repeat protein
MTSSLIRLIGLAFLVLAMAACQSDEEKLTEHMTRGDEYFEDEAFGEAIIEYKNVVQIDPNHGQAHYKLAQAQMLFLAKEIDEALLQIEAAIAADPNRVEAYVVKAQFLEAKERPEEALEAFEKAVELAPEEEGVLLLYANALSRRGDRENAERWYGKLIEAAPNFRSYFALGTFLVRGRDESREDEAVAAFRKAIEVAEPDEVARAHKGLAGYFYSQDRIDEAIATLEEGIEKADKVDLIDDKLDLMYTLANFHLAQGNEEEADALIEQATTAEPDKARTWLTLSRYRGQKGDLEGALAAARKAVEVEPDNEAARLRVAEVLIEIGVKEKREELIAEGRQRVEELLKQEPEHPGALLIKAKVDLIENRIDDCISAVRSAINSRPEWAQAHFVLGTCMAMKKDATGARSELARALEIDASLLQARRVLAQVHAGLRENEYAVEEGRRASPNRPNASSG